MPMGPLQIFSLLVGKGLQDILNYYLCMTHLQNFNSLSIKRRFREDAEGLQDVPPDVHLVLSIRLIHIFSIVTHYALPICKISAQ